jgi:hypothetical protein
VINIDFCVHWWNSLFCVSFCCFVGVESLAVHWNVPDNKHEEFLDNKDCGLSMKMCTTSPLSPLCLFVCLFVWDMGRKNCVTWCFSVKKHPVRQQKIWSRSKPSHQRIVHVQFKNEVIW